MVCDDEPSYRAIRESELDYLIAKNPDEAFDAIMRLKNSPELYRQMREQGEKRLQVYSREAVAARWYALFEDIWRKGLHNRPTVVRALRFGFGKAIRPLTKSSDRNRVLSCLKQLHNLRSPHAVICCVPWG